jgi:hypothetical protein
VNGRRWVPVVVLLAAALAAGGATQQPAATAQSQATGRLVAAEHRLVHVYEFPGSGIRLAPPTGQPRLPWQRALRAGSLKGLFDPHRPPEVKLADYSDSLLGPRRPVLAWVVVDPYAQSVPTGPAYPPGKARPVRPSRCPLYGFVDATTGRGYGAMFTCDPPYQG